jgi:Aminotransferase class-III
MQHSKNEQLLARKAAATPRGVGVMAPFFAERAENATLWDIEGRKFIDFAGGIAVLNTGHRHPKLVAALEAQLKRFTHTCYQVVPYESYIYDGCGGSGERDQDCAQLYQAQRRDCVCRRVPRAQPVRLSAHRQSRAVQDWLWPLPARDLSHPFSLPLRELGRGEKGDE